ncbi:alpha/beta hydrolase-fold protein [Georgenia muralis]|uniref:Enterochelin esterase-like enzyme n=1 Tax=Georgenia muralis TaxID=154117 RepID=A0A3N4ZAU4_9MICO|nr:alpha/beta hydrolase-fold protein [Georgenia muralis]RPF29056.1 enterochelin esterase-like enzyme [Georgenia muralis]
MTTRILRRPLTALAAVAVAGAGAVFALPALAVEHGTVRSAEAPSDAVGAIDYTVYLPAGYDTSDAEYPTVYLLHGRGDTQAAWQRVAGDLDEMIAAGTIQPMVVVMPDAPWNERGSWYTDSLYTGDRTTGAGAGVPVETAFTEDLVEHVDATYRTVEDRAARAVGGYSMGGAGALRFTLAHQDTFSAGIVLSPAVYVPQPPADSSTRDYGAYGVGHKLFDKHRYTELSYPTALEALDPSLPVHLFIAVGDDEWANPDPADASHDLDFEAAQLYNTARRVDGVTAELRVLDGGHDWDVWQPAFREAITDVSARLRTEPVAPWSAELVGTTADDRAGGVLALDDGTLVGLNVGAAYADVPYAGAMDVVLERRAADGSVTWRHALATAANDRAYGVVAGSDGGVVTAGYTRGDLDGAHPTGASDDAFVAGIDAAGARAWTTQLGDPAAADRIYAVASDGAGGAYVAGYTSGSVDGPSAGDKDALVAHVTADGAIAWTTQLGGTGEDKALAVASAPDGGVYVGGVAGGAMPGATHAGSLDGWTARLSAAGDVTWLNQHGTGDTDQVSGMAVRDDGTAIAVGHTGGRLGATAFGDKDAFALALAVDGSELWTTQLGTATDDRGVTAVARADGSVFLVGTTYGPVGSQVGGVDVFTAVLDAAGAVGELDQFGSADRDGADEWDEANLYAAGAPDGSVLVSGLTFGAPDGQTNAGAGDVFTMTIAP